MIRRQPSDRRGLAHYHRGRTAAGEEGVMGDDNNPRILRVVGGYIAATPHGCRFTFGVRGETEEEALDKYDQAFVKWTSLVPLETDGAA